MSRRPTISESSYRLAESLYSGQQDSDPDPLGLAEWIGFITVSEARALNHIYNKFLFFEPLLAESLSLDRESLWESFLLRETEMLSELIKNAIRGAWDKVSGFVGKKWSNAAKLLGDEAKDQAAKAWGRKRKRSGETSSSRSYSKSTGDEAEEKPEKKDKKSQSGGPSQEEIFAKIKTAAVKQITDMNVSKDDLEAAKKSIIKIIQQLEKSGRLSKDMSSSYMKKEEVPEEVIKKLLGSKVDEPGMQLALKSLFKVGAVNKP
jgi:hypothetical protein